MSPVIKSFRLLLTFIFLSACTSAPVVLEPDGCRTQASFFINDSQVETQTLKMKYWSVFGLKTLTVVDLLRQNELRCEELSSLSYKLSQDLSDIFLSLLPGFSRGSVELTYQRASNVLYHEPIRVPLDDPTMPMQEN